MNEKTVMREIGEKFLALAMVLVMLVAAFPAVSMDVDAAEADVADTAANVTTSVTNLGASDAGGAFSGNGTSISGSVTGKDATDGCSPTPASSATDTLTLTNNYTTAATLSFSYSPTVNGGSVTVDGSSKTAAGSFSKELAVGGQIQVVITSATGAQTTSISITNLKLEQKVVTATTTFAPSENGTYTVDGTAVTSNVSRTQASTQAYTLSASPASEYVFSGWKDVTNNTIISADNPAQISVDSNKTITAVFSPADAAIFKVGSKTFTDLNAADAYASSQSNKTIILMDNGKSRNMLYVGDYTISSGNTLLIPRDSSGTLNTTTPSVVTSRTEPSVYRKLTMGNGAKITVAGGGAICVNSQVFSAGGSNNGSGSPSGPYGQIVMENGSSIDVSGNGSLYAWGFITAKDAASAKASGTVTIRNGGKVYECFQVADNPGGSAAKALTGSSNTGDTFILNQYSIQNVEVPMTLFAGATETVYTNLYIQGTNAASATLIGSNSGLFRLTSGSLTKTYDPLTDRTRYDIDGNASIENITMSVYVTVNTADYVLPLNCNMDIHIHSGTTTMKNRVEMHPSVQIKVDSGATAVIDGTLYMFDESDWKVGYFGPIVKEVRSVLYSPTKSASHNASKDAMIDVNGTLNVTGKMYTTTNGADIKSSEGTGQVMFTSDPGSSNTSLVKAMSISGSSLSASVGSTESITMTPAQLHNGDGSYSPVSGTGTSTWKYDADGDHWYRYKVDFQYGGAKVGSGYICENTSVTYDASWLTGIGANASNGTASVSGSTVTVTGVTSDSVVTLTGTPAKYIPTFVLDETQYNNYYNFTGNTISDTVAIGGSTYYIVARASEALAVSTVYAAPTDTDMGVSAANHNAITWNISGVRDFGAAYVGKVPVGGTAGDPVYIYGFYDGIVAYNDVTDEYYPSLAEAFDDAVSLTEASTITMLADCGSFEEEDSTAAYPVANDLTVDLNGHKALGRIINNGSCALDLKGGTLDYHTGATAAAAAYAGLAAVINSGTMTINDTVGGGEITTDAISNASGASGSAVVRNNAGATLNVTGKDADHLLPLSHTQSVNGNNYGVFNLGTITELKYVDIATAKSGTTGVNVYNYNTGVIDLISGGHMFAYSGASLFNYGGTITTVDGLTIDGKNGITNRNIRSGALASGYTVTDANTGKIGTIANCHIEVGQYAINNNAKINTLDNSTFIAHPDSAQVDTRGNGTTASEGNVQCYTIYNNYAWFYDTNLWKRTDVSSGKYERTDEYREDEAYRPTIGTITNCEIYAENTSTSASHGYALVNYGVIGKIGGTTNIKAYKHPNNAKISTSHYSLHNLGGGIIKSIEGTANISATGVGTVYNDGVFTTQVNYTYGNKVGGNITYQKSTYGEPSTINSITCSGTWSCGSGSGLYYALMNSGHIGTINSTGLTLEGGYNVLYNATGGANSTYEITKKYTDTATASTEYERNTSYVKNLEKGSTIGTINGITINVKGTKVYQGLNNQGHIGTLSNVNVGFASGATNNSSSYPLVLNGDSRYKTLQETIRTNRTSETDPHLTVKAGIVTKYDRAYTYDTPTIDTIDNLTVTSIGTYAFRNAGNIGTMKNSKITGTQYAMHNSDSGSYTERTSEQYYSGTSMFATTRGSSDLANHYKRNPASITTIENCAFTTTTNNYAMLNGGHVGTIKNSTLQAGTTAAKAYALSNTSNTIREYTRDLSDIVYITANAGTACTTYYGSGGESDVVTYDYDAPTIDLIGEGNTFTATTTVIANTGTITAINSGTDTPTTITGSGAKGSSIYNYTANLDARTTTTPYTAAASANASGTKGTAVNDDTYLSGAQIGTIKNVYINANGYGILNGSGAAAYAPVIGEIGEGTEIYAHCTTAGYHAIYNQANAKITEISGGVYTVTKATTNAYRNNNTVAANATLISGGDFKGMSATRANAIYEPDNTNRQTYADGKKLSTNSRSAAFNNGTATASGTGYYYLADTYTVSFDVQGHGTAPVNQMVESGQKTAKPADPSATGYRFDGWYKEAACTNAWNFTTDTVTKDTTLYAKWTALYTVTWKNGGTTLETDTNVPQGSTPSYDGATPTKAATAEYTYTFKGWSKDGETVIATLPAVTADVTYQAVFETSKRSYAITWKNDDGSTIDTTTLEYGQLPTHANPTKAATAEYTYTFNGWSPVITAVTGNATYTATFTEHAREYTITWKNDDGSTINTTSVAYGTKPTHADAAKAATAQYTYTFIGWTPTIVNVTGDATYTATFSSTVNKYDVIFNMKNHGTAVTQQTVEYGKKVTEPEAPAIGSVVTEDGNQYRFDGWYKNDACTTEWNFDDDTVTGNTTLYAKWTTVHTVTFDSDNESVQDVTVVVAENETAEVPAVPDKEPDRQYSYQADGWQVNGSDTTVYAGDTVTASSNVTYTPVYTKTVNKYQIRWLNEDGTPLINNTVEEYGKIPECPLDTVPTKAPDAQYTYTFSHWKVSVDEWNANQIVTESGTASTGSASPKSGIVSTGASYKSLAATGGETGNVNSGVVALEGQTTYTAVFTKNVNEYTVTWKNGDITLKTEQTAYGETPTAPAETPTKAYADGKVYFFTGWTPAIAPVTGDAEYTAVFREEKIFNKHSLTLDGTIGVSFYVLLPEGYTKDNTLMDFSWGHKYISTNTYSEDEPYSKHDVEGTAAGDYVKYTVYVAAKELNDDITAVLKEKDTGTEIVSEIYRGTGYAYDVLGTPNTELQLKLDATTPGEPGKYEAAKLKTLVKDLLIYSAKAQVNFAYYKGAGDRFSDLATYRFGEFEGLSAEPETVDTSLLHGNNIGALPAGVSYYGGSLNLGSETSYMVVLRNDNKLDLDVSAKYADTGEDLATEVRSSGVAAGLNLQNIPAAKVTSDITMTINGSCTATVNTGSYIKAVLDGSYSDDLKSVMKALYHYNQAAVHYFG